MDCLPRVPKPYVLAPGPSKQVWDMFFRIEVAHGIGEDIITGKIQTFGDFHNLGCSCASPSGRAHFQKALVSWTSESFCGHVHNKDCQAKQNRGFRHLPFMK